MQSDEGLKFVASHKIIRELGSGHAATVYEVLNTITQERSAVKVVQQYEEVDNELEILKLVIDFPGFVQLKRWISCSTLPGQWVGGKTDVMYNLDPSYIMMEMNMASGTLRQLMESSLNLRTFKCILFEVIAILTRADKLLNFTHKDLNPSNILYVVDLGGPRSYNVNGAIYVIDNSLAPLLGDLELSDVSKSKEGKLDDQNYLLNTLDEFGETTKAFSQRAKDYTEYDQWLTDEFFSELRKT